MTIFPEDILKLLLALALGGMIGAEREMRDKAAGFRTLMFISAGSALFTIFSLRISSMVIGPNLPGDPARIAAQIVTGIGFLGAGVILREHGEIRGLTTAATVWMVAALGMGVGSGQYLFSVAATAVLVLSLFIFPKLEAMINTITQVRTYTIMLPASHEKFLYLNTLFKKYGLVIYNSRRTRQRETMICTWTAAGRPEGHEQMAETLFNDPDVQEFEM
jgi:putative Mg2+ transporter-C (MgtC) family protein